MRSVRLGLGWLACLFVVVPTVAQDLFVSLQTIAPGANGYDVSGKTLNLGRLEFEFQAGALFPLVDGDGTASGFVFEGKGRYVYRVDDLVDLETFQRNCDLQAKNLAHSDRSIYDTFDRALLVMAQPQWKEELGSVASQRTPTSLSEWFQKRWQKIETEWSAASHRIAESRLNIERGQVAYVEIDGDHAPAAYQLELQRGRSESFGTLWQPPGYDWRAYRSISFQAGAGWERKPKPRWIVDKLSLDVTKREKVDGTVRGTLSIKILAAGQRVLSFDLLNSRDDAPTSNWTSQKNKLTLRRVTDAAGRELRFSHRFDELLVDLGEAPPVDTRLELSFEIEGEFFTAKGGERGDVVADLSRVAWYPSPIGFGDASFTLDLSVRCGKNLRPISTGDTVELKEDGDDVVMRARSETPVSFASLLMGKYVSYKIDLGGGRTLGVHGYGNISQETVNQQAAVFAELLRSLERLLGELPYREVDIVEDPEDWAVFSYGRTTPGVVMVSSPMFRPFMMNPRSTGRQMGGEVLVAHELAHQWFGVSVRPASTYDNWLSESVAEYLSGMVAQDLKLDNRSVQRSAMRGWSSLYGEWDGYAPWCKDWSIEAANSLAGANSGEYRYCLLYQRGPRTLHMLRGWMGDQAFLTILKRFLATYKNQRVTSDDFSFVLSKATGKEMRWYVDDWFRRGPKPPIKVSAELQQATDGRPQIVAHASQPAGTFARVFVPLVLREASGGTSVKLLMIDSAETTATIPLETMAGKVEVDPFKLNLVEYTAPKKK